MCHVPFAHTECIFHVCLALAMPNRSLLKKVLRSRHRHVKNAEISVATKEIIEKQTELFSTSQVAGEHVCI